jgi:hypothetical protein
MEKSEINNQPKRKTADNGSALYTKTPNNAAAILCSLYLFSLIIVNCSLLIISCTSTQSRQAEIPLWVTNLEKAYPSKDWVAVTAQGSSQAQAESLAMNALARAYRTDIASLTQSSQQYSEIINNAANNKNITFNESKNFSQEIITTTNIKGLIGVQTDVYRENENTVHINARINSVINVSYSGAQRESDWWTLRRRYDPDDKNAFTDEYTGYVLYTIPKAEMNRQVANALETSVKADSALYEVTISMARMILESGLAKWGEELSGDR